MSTVDGGAGASPHTTVPNEGGEATQVQQEQQQQQQHLAEEVKEGCPANASQAGYASQCDGCPGKALCQSQAHDPDVDAIGLRMRAVRRRVLVLSGKGGVGKSAVAVNLALALACSGKRVALLDLDLCGPSVPGMLDLKGNQVVNSPYGWKPVKPIPSLSVMSVGFLLHDEDAPVIWRGPRKTTIIKKFLKDTFWSKQDYMIVDTPPGTSDEHISVVAALKQAAPEGAILVTTPQDVALATVRKELSFCRKMGVPVLGLVENMTAFACPCCAHVTPLWSDGSVGDADESAAKRLAREQGIAYLGAVPLDPCITAAADAGTLMALHQCPEAGDGDGASTPGMLAFQALAQRLHDMDPADA